MHDAVEDDVRVATECRADHDSSKCQVFPAEYVRNRNDGSQLERADEQPNGRRNYHGRPELRVEEPMQRKPPGNHVVQRLDIDDHVGGAERQKTDLSRCRRVQSCSGAEMEWCDRHG